MPRIVKISGTLNPGSDSAVTNPAMENGSAAHSLTADRALTAEYAEEAALAAQADDLTEDSPVRDQFAYKDRDDEIREIWRFVKYMKSKHQVPGAFGYGFFLGDDPDNPGHSLLEVDRLYVRMKAIFDSLEIRHLSHVGGVQVLSPAAMEIIAVEETEIFVGSDSLKDSSGDFLRDASGNYLSVPDPASLHAVYRCYFRATDGESTITNDFSVGDLVRSSTFNLTSGQRFFWRRCMAVGEDYIDLSKTDCAIGSDAPVRGDTVATFGNVTDVNRQNVVEMAAYGSGSPSITLYQGIKSYSTVGCDKVRIAAGASKFTGELVVMTESGEQPLAEFTEALISLKAKDIKINGNTQITDADGNVVALFANGKLRAALIDTDQLTARRIRTAESGARSVIEGGRHEYYDDSGVLRLLVHGASLDPSNVTENAISFPTQSQTVAADSRTAVIYSEDFPMAGPCGTDLSKLHILATVTVTRQPGDAYPEGLPCLRARFRIAQQADGPVSDEGSLPETTLWQGDISVMQPGTHILSPQSLPVSAWMPLFEGADTESGEAENPMRLCVYVELTEVRGDITGQWTVAVSTDSSTLPLVPERTCSEVAADGACLRAAQSKYLRVSDSDASIRFGQRALRITDAGFQFSEDGGSTWSTIDFSTLII